MSGEDNNTINTPMMKQLMTMLNNRFNSIEESNTNMNININRSYLPGSTPSQDCPQEHLQERQVPKQLHEKLPEFELPLETPRGQCPDVQVSMTEIFRDAKAADDFAEVNKGRERRERKPAINQRDSTISRRETFAATQS